MPLATLNDPVVKLAEHQAPIAVFSPLPPFEADKAAYPTAQLAVVLFKSFPAKAPRSVLN